MLYKTKVDDLDDHLRAHYSWFVSSMVVAGLSDEKMQQILDCSLADLWRLKGYTLAAEEKAACDVVDRMHADVRSKKS